MSQPSPVEDLRHSLAARLTRARSITDSLFGLLSQEALLARPIPERHRVLFYLGHLEAFDRNLLGHATFHIEPFSESLDTLFAFGIDPVDGSLPDDRPSDWPQLDEIQRYVRNVRKETDRLLTEADFDASANLNNGKVVEVAVEHRLMHAETLTYMLHWLPADLKDSRAEHSAPRRAHRAVPKEVDIPGGAATLGLAPTGAAFGWDNEFNLTEIKVPAFAIDALNVTNGEFLEFVQSGGYSDRSLWLEVDWAWRAEGDITHPRFWGLRHGEWLLRTMFDHRPLPPNWPVYVSHAEASAYARWAGKTLPTEAQLHRAAYATPEGPERPFPWGNEPPDSTRGNFNFQQWNPLPVGSCPEGNSAFGVSDLLGNGWEWTSTVFSPFEGFEPFAFYPGYSADFFDEQHFVVKGGSSHTSACMLRRSFRNWFQPHYPNIYAAFRCVQS